MNWINNSILDAKGAPAIYEDTLANIPAYNLTGMLFVSTDTFAFYRNNGSGWDLIGGPGTGTITGSGTAGKLTKFTGVATIGDSIITESVGAINVAGSVTATVFNGSGAGLTSIPNSALTNSAITIGTTSIALGASSTTLIGLTSITSVSFVSNAQSGVFFDATTASVNGKVFNISNTGAAFTIGQEGSLGNTILTNAAAYSAWIGTTNNTSQYIITNATIRQTIDGGGNMTISGPSLTVSILSTAGIVTNTAAGLLGTSAGTGFIKMTAGTVSYDNSTYITGNQTITLSGEASGAGATAISVTLANSAVIGKVLTGYISGAGIVAATDTILQAIEKLNGNIGALVTGVSSFNTRTGAVTLSTADVNAVAATTVGTVTVGIWNAGAVTSSEAVTGTVINATATGAVFDRTGVSTIASYMHLGNTTGNIYIGIEGSAGGIIITGSPAYMASIAGISGLWISADNGGSAAIKIASTNEVTLTATTNSTSTSTGALIVPAGGIGAGGNIFSLGFLNATGNNLLNSTSGYTSIGTANNTYKLNVVGTIYDTETQTTLNQSKIAVLGGINFNTTGTETNQYANAGTYGVFIYSNVSGTFTPFGTGLWGGVVGSNQYGGGGTLAGTCQSVLSAIAMYGTVNVTTVAGFRVLQPQQLVGGAAYTGTVTNMVGVYIDDISGSAIAAQFTNKYAVYQAGANDKNFFNGEIQMGTGQVVSASVLNTVTNKVKMIINGTTYYLLASTSGV